MTIVPSLVHVNMPFNHPLRVLFFRTEGGNEPVREWLRNLPKDERTLIGEDLKKLQFRWPLSMPLVRYLEANIYEVRTHLPNRIARTLFFVHEASLVMLCGFIKKTRKTPDNELNLAKKRMRDFLSDHA